MTRELQSRSNETREQTTTQYTFTEPNWLKLPESVERRFKNEGKKLRWLRASLKGAEDYQNMGKRLNEGWELVTESEVPELMHASFVREEGRYTGAVSRGDLVLAKMPIELSESRQDFYANKSRQAVDAVNQQLMNSSDSRMPISNNSRTRVSKGSQPSFQD
jgi:hypothetical protein